MKPKTTILIPIDLDDDSSHLLDKALDIGRKLDAELVLLHVYSLPAYVYPGIPPAQLAIIREKVAAAAGASLDAIAARLGGLRTLLREGDPANEILAGIEWTKPDFVIMGTHGRRGLARFFVGSVAEAVARRSTVPVMTVRPCDDASKTAA